MQEDPQGRAPRSTAEERLRLLIGSVKDYAIFMLDPEGRVETWNPGAESIKGYTAAEIIGQHISRFYTEEDQAAGRPRRLLREAEERGRTEDEGWRLRKDGTRFWADVVITAVRDEAGVLRGFAKVTRDLTERRRAEEERLRLAQAQEALRLRDEFLSIASHELRTPLTALELQLQSIREQARALDAKIARRIERALGLSARMTALIDTLLDVSRLASGRFELRLGLTDLAALVRESAEHLREAAALARCDLQVSAPQALPGAWDQLRLEQLLANLLTNAFKYAAGNPVELSLEQEGEAALLRVRDKGPGIPEAALERIFGRFERAASIRHYGGLGLGLYVARQIAEAHGGAISAENRAGGGACFTVRLPLKPRRAEPR